MQTVKERHKTDLLKVLLLLNSRMTLEDDDRKMLINLEKGYDGELFFDALLDKHFTGEGLVLNDLKICYRGNSAQIDSLLITQHSIELFEVKNYSGQYTFSKNRMVSLKGIEIPNPITQLNRTLSLMRQLLNEWGIELDLNGHIIFVNRHFTLYVGEPNHPFILPTQIELFLIRLANQSRRLKQGHQYLADKLLHYSVRDLSHQKEWPDFNWDNLKKGFSCKECGSLKLSRTQRKTSCNDCLHEESISAALSRNIEDLTFLFPNQKLTTTIVHHWVNESLSKERISKFLKSNYSKRGVSRAIHYEYVAVTKSKTS